MGLSLYLRVNFWSMDQKWIYGYAVRNYSGGRHRSAEFCVKESMHLYAYPVTYFLSEVKDYPHIVGNSQIFDRMLYL